MFIRDRTKLVSSEIISVDSVQVYKGMDIGSGKPSKEILDRHPHKLVSFIDPWKSYSRISYGVWLSVPPSCSLSGQQMMIRKWTNLGPNSCRGWPMELEFDWRARPVPWAVDNLWMKCGKLEFGELGSLERTTDQPSKD